MVRGGAERHEHAPTLYPGRLRPWLPDVVAVGRRRVQVRWLLRAEGGGRDRLERQGPEHQLADRGPGAGAPWRVGHEPPAISGTSGVSLPSMKGVILAGG